MNRCFDAGLRGVHLQLLDRDLDLARRGVLGAVVPATDWQRIRRNWRYPPNIATVIVHDVPMSDGCGTHRLSGGYLPPPGGMAAVRDVDRELLAQEGICVP